MIAIHCEVRRTDPHVNERLDPRGIILILPVPTLFRRCGDQDMYKTTRLRLASRRPPEEMRGGGGTLSTGVARSSRLGLGRDPRRAEVDRKGRTLCNGQDGARIVVGENSGGRRLHSGTARAAGRHCFGRRGSRRRRGHECRRTTRDARREGLVHEERVRWKP